MITLQVGMKGDWVGAFGIRKMVISDIVGGIGIGVDPPFILMLELGGKIRISNGLDDTRPVTGSLYFKINLDNPRENYFYGRMTGVTIGNICSKILDISSSGIPKFLSETGFNEVAISYAMQDTVLPDGTEIPMGIKVFGDINILGVSAVAEIIISTKRFLFRIDLSSFTIGFLKVARSRTYYFIFCVLSNY